MVALYVVTAFTAAALLFTIQPMVGRLLLPALGGVPAVWNTAMVFFQAALLAGYAYAHYMASGRSPERRALLHVLLLALGLAALPVRVPGGWAPPTETDPTAWLLAALAVGAGVPFFLVSTTGPLIQRWFSRTRHRGAGDPYFLYAASNLGSLGGLLAYPFLIEPGLPLATQSRLWTIGYVLLVGLAALLAWSLRRNVAPGPAEPVGAEPPPAPPTTRRRLRWMLLAFGPSSLMLGVTAHLSTDIAAIPLLWIVPLSIYLLTFTLAFARGGGPLVSVAARLLPMSALGLVIVIVSHAAGPLPVVIGLHLLTLCAAALGCHGALAADRPEPGRLTEYYLWIAAGGALGGVFNAIVAPLVFRSVVEYPIALVLCCALVPAVAAREPRSRDRVVDVALPVLLGLFTASLVPASRALGWEWSRLALVILISMLAFPVFSFRRRPLRLALGIAALLVASPANLEFSGRTLHAERSFFGVHRVVADTGPAGSFRRLVHGTTVHGIQRTEPDRCSDPLGYYHRLGPAGQIMTAPEGSAPRAVAVAGLGSGGLAAYGRAGETWTFYEIDPAVVRIARDPRKFCFLSGSPAGLRFRLGDARQALENDRSARYDVLVLDAYSSDAIPVHLLTREAVRLYVSRLAPGGRLVLHISNRYFDLAPVVARLAEDQGLACRIREDSDVDEDEIAAGRLPSEYAVLARSPEDLGDLAGDPRWRTPEPEPGRPVWTDDYSSLVSVLR